MRKKDLLSQNISLYEQLRQSQLEINELREKLKKSTDEIAALKNTVQEKEKTEPSAATPIRNLQEKVSSDNLITPDIKYASKVIGDIVVSAARCSNLLTANGDDSHRELVNLILGRTELAKSDILEIVCGDAPGSDKKCRVDKICDDAKEYFEGVLAQLI